jgi:hypothetical protein
MISANTREIEDKLPPFAHERRFSDLYSKTRCLWLEIQSRSRYVVALPSSRWSMVLIRYSTIVMFGS